MRPMAESICEAFLGTSKRLMDLGLGYLTLDRSASTLSTGERQRMQLARAVRNRTTGVLYVLDEPSIGLHPANIVGLTGVMHDLVADGNSVILVDHDTQILKEADWIVGCFKDKPEPFRLRFVPFAAIRSADFLLFSFGPTCSNSILGQKWVKQFWHLLKNIF